MKILRSMTFEHIGQGDIDRLAMEMVNLYHGIQIYDSSAGRRLEKPRPGYLTWITKGIENTLVPSRGYICINSNSHFGGWTINAKTLMRNLVTAFNNMNRWGYRQEEYKFSDKTDTQMTLTSIDNPTGSIVELTDKSWDTYKNTQASMLWYLSSDVALMQFDIPIQTKDPWKLTVPATTIVLDLRHEDYLVPGFQSLNPMPLPSNYKIMKEKIRVDPESGAELHLWARLTSKLDEPLVFTSLGDLKCYTAPPEEKLKLDEKCQWSTCSSCTSPVWSKFYILANKEGVSKPVCRFCMHYAPRPAMGDDQLILVAESKLTAMNVVNGIRDMTYEEREAVKHMLIKGVKWTDPQLGVAEGHYKSEPYISLSSLQNLSLKHPRDIAACKMPIVYFRYL